jgi:hypothetical protein
MNTKNVLKGIAIACAICVLAVSMKDIKRYIRISTM